MPSQSVHEMSLPQRVVIGEGIIDSLSEFETRLAQAKNVFVATGPHVFDKLGDEVDRTWTGKQEVTVSMVGEADMNEVERNAEKADEAEAEVILALGGGRVIDVAKMTAFRSDIDFVSVPTTASHDGLSNQFASIRGEQRKSSYVTKPPASILVDIDVIMESPKRLTGSGVGDAMAKKTAVEDWRLGHEETGEYFGEYAANLALLGASLVHQKAEDIGKREKDSIRTLVEALISDGVAAGIAGSSRPCSGSEHLFSHALDLYCEGGALHGEQCGVGTIIMAYLHDMDHQEIRDTLRKVGAPTNSSELGTSREEVVEAIHKARNVRPERYTILHELKPSRADAERFAEESGVLS